jgi:hypothetical protein
MSRCRFHEHFMHVTYSYREISEWIRKPLPESGATTFSFQLGSIDHHYAECRVFYCYAECHYAKCHYDECRYAKCHYDECHYDECRCYADCRGAPGAWMVHLVLLEP